MALAEGELPWGLAVNTDGKVVSTPSFSPNDRLPEDEDVGALQARASRRAALGAAQSEAQQIENRGLCTPAT